MQMEAASFLTSPIHTIAATVTRAVDDVRLATSAFPLSYSTSTLVAEFVGKVRQDYCRPITLSQGGSLDDFFSYYFDSSGAVNLQYFRNGGGQSSITTPGTVVVGNTHKIAAAWASNDLAGVMDGGTVKTQGTFTVPDSFDTLGIGSYPNATDPLSGYIRKITYLARRAPNAELQTRTT